MEGKEKSSGSNLNSKWLGAKGLSTWLEACREDRGHVRMQECRGPMWGWGASSLLEWGGGPFVSVEVITHAGLSVQRLPQVSSRYQ